MKLYKIKTKTIAIKSIIGHCEKAIHDIVLYGKSIIINWLPTHNIVGIFRNLRNYVLLLIYQDNKSGQFLLGGRTEGIVRERER